MILQARVVYSKKLYMLITRSREMTEFDSLTCSETAKQMKGEQLPLCELSIIRYFIYTSSRSCTSHRNLFISISMYSVISIFYRKIHSSRYGFGPCDVHLLMKELPVYLHSRFDMTSTAGRVTSFGCWFYLIVGL